jgi:ABC-type sugar transport system ATPase subunit
MTDHATLEVRNLSKNYGGIFALADVSLSFRAGEVTAIVGDNGAGKSTLLKAMCGALTPDTGKIIVEGREFEFRGPNDARQAGIETVHQDLALANNLSVAQNMFLGREEVTGFWPFKFLKTRSMNQKAYETINGLSVNVPSPQAVVEELSGGQRQAIAIARATTWGNYVVLMDEPTAALGVTETARVEQLIATLRDRGLCVVIVSHDLGQVVRVSDRVAVMRQGRLAAHLLTSQTSGDEILALITGLKEESRRG